jgi:hypothetical protein
MKKMKPPFTDPRDDMIDPKVQRHGDVALLTFNLVLTVERRSGV